MNRQRMVTLGDWKYISYPTAGVERLFNLKKDPHEMDDLADNPEYAEKLKTMRAVLSRLSQEMDDPGPKAGGKKKRKKYSKTDS